MHLKLFAAFRKLRHRRIRRRLVIERARLDEMESNAAALLNTQRSLVGKLEHSLDGALPPTDLAARHIARDIERRAKAPLLA